VFAQCIIALTVVAQKVVIRIDDQTRKLFPYRFIFLHPRHDPSSLQTRAWILLLQMLGISYQAFWVLVPPFGTFFELIVPHLDINQQMLCDVDSAII
jgi:hypothetical protein